MLDINNYLNDVQEALDEVRKEKRGHLEVFDPKDGGTTTCAQDSPFEVDMFTSELEFPTQTVLLRATRRPSFGLLGQPNEGGSGSKTVLYETRLSIHQSELNLLTMQTACWAIVSLVFQSPHGITPQQGRSHPLQRRHYSAALPRSLCLPTRCSVKLLSLQWAVPPMIAEINCIEARFQARIVRSPGHQRSCN